MASKPLPRRALLRAGTAGGAALLGGQATAPLRAQGERLTAYGAGVNLKLMPDEAGNPVVPMRELFAFDPLYAQCIVEDNAQRFAMETFAMGRVVVEPHRFFMAMYAEAIALEEIRRGPDGSLTAVLQGRLACATYAGTATVAVGSRTVAEHATYRIEATDGGIGGGAAGDRFAFTVFFDPEEAPVNHDLFGPEFTFTGELVSGEITIVDPNA